MTTAPPSEVTLMAAGSGVEEAGASLPAAVGRVGDPALAADIPTRMPTDRDGAGRKSIAIS
jgi:hypothetical protein